MHKFRLRLFADGIFLFGGIELLQLKNIEISLKKSGKNIIENLNYTLQKGVKCAVIGEEGDGKSTVLKFIISLRFKNLR